MKPVVFLLALAIAAPGARPLLGQASQWPGRYPYTRADVDFVTGMISHHAQAVVMANWAPTHGAGRSVSILCARIVNAQTDEINLFQQWLSDRNQPVPEAKPLPMKMMMNGVEHEMMMPGMLTDDQMKELEAAQGPEFDRLFLKYMVQHHQGAITMVDQLMASPAAAQDEVVYKFASDIYADQSAEIERMQQMLSTLQSR
ncbi:MAG: DUF305 domain-containing protein [Gemmatimonadetes bacterium]|nr:DUF305 domain-containing protein [Gemmatimonadota bacterium]